ncbi:hypothetical protein, partial [Metabacillus idriensis]|uniref:hypothetical protein n=1 Tax=Metabacillus idriensis TaxID=324768 RepID=UPI003D272B19
LADPYLSVRAKRSVPLFLVSSFTSQLFGQNGSSSKGKKRLYWLILICLSELNGRFRFSFFPKVLFNLSK